MKYKTHQRCAQVACCAACFAAPTLQQTQPAYDVLTGHKGLEVAEIR
jgi:hypothetical protein